MEKKCNFEVAQKRMCWVVAIWLVLMIALALCGCKQTEYVTVEKVRTDTTYVTKWHRDSVWLHDSVLVREKGDSVLIEKWHTKYIETIRTDTTYVATHDTVPAPFPQTEYVEKELSWWQRLRIILGNFVLLAIVALAGYWLWRLWKVYHFF